MTDRHPGVVELLGYFHYEHLQPVLARISQPFHDLAHEMVDAMSDGPELTAGLRKLLEAKDCFVRHAVRNR